MLAILLRCILVLSWFKWWTNQALCVSHFTFCQFGVHLVAEQSFKQTLCDSSFTKIHSYISIIQPVNKADTMCLLFYCGRYGYIWSFYCDLRKTYMNSHLSRHYMLAILLRRIQVISWCDQSTKQTLCGIYFTFCQFGVHVVMELLLKQTFCVSSFTKIYLII